MSIFLGNITFFDLAGDLISLFCIYFQYFQTFYLCSARSKVKGHLQLYHAYISDPNEPAESTTTEASPTITVSLCCPSKDHFDLRDYMRFFCCRRIKFLSPDGKWWIRARRVLVLGKLKSNNPLG